MLPLHQALICVYVQTIVQTIANFTDKLLSRKAYRQMDVVRNLILVLTVPWCWLSNTWFMSRPNDNSTVVRFYTEL